jgi:glucokinase
VEEVKLCVPDERGTSMTTEDRAVVLAGDIGGTKTNLGLYSIGGRRPEVMRMASFPSAEAAGLSEMLHKFLRDGNEPPIAAACFGVAGPVAHGRCKITNLTWEVSQEEIREEFRFSRVKIINDLTATGYGVTVLEADEALILNTGTPDPEGAVGLVAPGTGLGMAILIHQQGRLIPLPSEGGHVDFAPRNEREVSLLRHLSKKEDHVSVERLVSGTGIQAIYSWLKEFEEYEEPVWLSERMKSGDPSAVISEAALNEEAPICVEALNMFVSMLGATCGNLALTAMTTGGFYLGGGVPPKIIPRLVTGRFMDAFADKGRFRSILSAMPVNVILNDKIALLGAAVCAAR